MPNVASVQQYYEPAPIGPAMQYWVPASVHGLPITIPAGSQVSTNLIVSEGYTLIGAGVISTQAGAIKVQPYLDEAGTMSQAQSTQAITANALAMVSNNANSQPFMAFQILVTNTGSAPATLSNFGLLLQAR